MPHLLIMLCSLTLVAGYACVKVATLVRVGGFLATLAAVAVLQGGVGTAKSVAEGWMLNKYVSERRS